MTFHHVARSGQVREGVVRRILVGATEIALLRSSGKIYAMANRCTHEGCRLSDGRVTSRGLRCPCHGSLFDFRTGAALNPPAVRPVDVFGTREEDGQVWVWLDHCPSVTHRAP